MTHMERILLTLLPQYTHPSPMEEFFLEQEGRNLRFTSLLSRLIYDRLNRWGKSLTPFGPYRLWDGSVSTQTYGPCWF
jgi:hypothetical protein